MSQPSAIAAVTQALRAQIEVVLQDFDSSIKVTTLPLDRSNAEAGPANRLNLFLFQVFTNAAWRNTDLPDRARPGELGRPPLALNLSYMLTAYGEPGLSSTDHVILGLTMKYLNDHPLLMGADIPDSFKQSGLGNQVDRVRFTPRALTLEEMVRMWGTFMTQYRISAAYDAAVVLIDSDASGPAPLPVVRRGDQDQGVFAEASAPPFLTQTTPPPMIRRGTQVTYQPAVRLGEKLTVAGQRLTAEDALVQIKSPAWGSRWAGVSSLVAGDEPDTLQFVLADPPVEIEPPPGNVAPLSWSPGVYTLALLLRRLGRPDIVSNAVPFALAPSVQLDPTHGAPGDVDLTIRCMPPVRAGQPAFLMVPGRSALAPVQVTPPNAAGEPALLKFSLKALAAGTYLARLRVDGVDSLPYRIVHVPGQSATLDYDPAHQLVIA